MAETVLKYIAILFILFVLAISLYAKLSCDLGLSCSIILSDVLVNFLYSLIVVLFGLILYRIITISGKIAGSTKVKVQMGQPRKTESLVDMVKNGKYKIPTKRPPSWEERKIMQTLYKEHSWSKDMIIGVRKGYVGFYGYKDSDILKWVNAAIGVAKIL